MQLTEKEIDRVYRGWRSWAPISDEVKEGESLRTARLGLQLSSTEVGRRLGMTASAYLQLEAGEKKGSLSMGNLKKIAEAMDCEVTLQVRPKKFPSFKDAIWNVMLSAVKNHPWLKVCDQRKRSEALYFLIHKRFYDAQFRKSRGWSQRIGGG